MFEALISWRRRRETMRALASLSDRELADVGMARSGIEQVVRSACERADIGPRARSPFQASDTRAMYRGLGSLGLLSKA